MTPPQGREMRLRGSIPSARNRTAINHSAHFARPRPLSERQQRAASGPIPAVGRGVNGRKHPGPFRADDAVTSWSQGRCYRLILSRNASVRSQMFREELHPGLVVSVKLEKLLETLAGKGSAALR